MSVAQERENRVSPKTIYFLQKESIPQFAQDRDMNPRCEMPVV